MVISSYYSGDSTDMYEQWVKGTALSGGTPIIGPGRPIDTDRYYVVMVDPLGTWGASKPSDGLGTKFPQYSYYDMVQANYRMLRDHLKVTRCRTGHRRVDGRHADLRLGRHASGIRAGAMMPIGGTTQSDAEDPVGNWTFQLMTAAIESDPVWQATKGDYYNLPKEKHPLPGVAFGWSVLGLDRLRPGVIAPRRPSRRFSRKCSTGIRRTRRPAQASPSAPRSTMPSTSSGATGLAKPTTSIRISAASSRGRW